MNRNGATTWSDESEEIVVHVGLARRNNSTTKEYRFIPSVRRKEATSGLGKEMHFMRKNESFFPEVYEQSKGE